MPDFVLRDEANGFSAAAEFKPPNQTKREYLTGLGQAIAYSRDFHYSLLVVPLIADDGYPIAQHINGILQQPELVRLPITLLSYDPIYFSPHSSAFEEAKFATAREIPPEAEASLDASFYAKFRESSPEEIFALLSFSYDEMSIVASSTIRDRAFASLWKKIQDGNMHHWGGKARHYKESSFQNIRKNYRNFIFHIGWTESDGALTKGGLEALHLGKLYGPNSRPFIDGLAKAVLGTGKHLILFNAISSYQDAIKPPFPSEEEWLKGLEGFLEAKGLLKRNPERAAAAIAGSARQFLKAEKQLWKQLELILPRQKRVFHPGRGFIFNWARITDLLS